WRYSSELSCFLGFHLCFGMFRPGPCLLRRASACGAHGIRPRARARHCLYQWHADTTGTGPAILIGTLLRHCPADQHVRLRRFDCHGKIPAARRGDRAMIDTLPLWVAIPSSLLLVIAGVITLTGSL